MALRPPGEEEHHLLSHVPSLSGSSLLSNSDDTASEYELEEEPLDHEKHPKVLRVRARRWTLPWRRRPRRKTGSTAAYFSMAPGRRRRGWAVRAVQCLMLLPYLVGILVLVTGLFFPSYSHPPKQYVALRSRIEGSDKSGRGNPNNEKVFVATSLYDHEGELLGGKWGENLKELVEVLGEDNVFLSIYENDPDDGAEAALLDYEAGMAADNAIVSEHLDLAELPHVTTPEGASRLKRIAFLAEVRNRALLPLTDPGSIASKTKFDKLLYVNDVFFSPADAANLLFSTNLDDPTNRTDYRAACAVDFINPFKFYDTFATRDAEGNQMGVPFYPWFTRTGNAASRNDVLAHKDAVRVRSCWGGMVAFEAKWFQPQLHAPKIASPAKSKTAVSDHANDTTGLRFRAETDTYWDASECCLIHADLAALSATSPNSEDTGVYMNPYVRVAYTPATLRYLPFTRRFERLYPWIHHLINVLANRPGYNPRRLQVEGEKVRDVVWSKERGVFESVERVAGAGGFCGGRMMEYLKEGKEGEGEGGGKWGFEKVPPEVLDG
ncbi:hypothetical protein B0A48_16269 [Cryoendolithus antarcticus]|uniref:Glycosyltransferase family 69 protein n=1 Tax=Cryoendolithus antarcticus TaxID=1507870 RepID=A0A1V8SFN7_9PEZI|nr:hypothetical protein B0A48_16269 [Cryoendolithus antarcticus]